MKAIMDKVGAFAHTQALWRFLHNDRINLRSLSEPVVALAKEQSALSCDAYVLVAHDWSRLNYLHHESKKDRVQMTHKKDIGYELQSSILISDRDGLPIAVPRQNLVTSEGVWQSGYGCIQEERPHLDELTTRITELEAEDFGHPLVHIVDREADSVWHLRAWKTHNFIVRVKGGCTVRCEGKDQKISEVAKYLTYQQTRQVLYQGKVAIQWVGEAAVVLARKAKPAGRDENGKRKKAVAGEPLPVRLVVSRICDEQGKILAEWFLMSNLPKELLGERIALWYYYRWNIESFFKLLKEAGCQLESWEQETGQAIAKRLLIVSQSCAVVWQLLRAEGIEAEQLRAFLVRLSGRQMKRKRPVTPTALMDGFFKFMAMLETLQHYPLTEIERMASLLFPKRQWDFV